MGVLQHRRIRTEAVLGDLGQVDQHRRVLAAGVAVWVGHLAKPVDAPKGIVVGEGRNIEGLIESPLCSNLAVVRRRFDQIYPPCFEN